MSVERTPEYLADLLTELRRLPGETSWLEFKENNSNPEEIGEYVSALANMAALAGKANGYVVWGIRDDSHDVVGTSFRPATLRKGGAELESWLLQLLTPRVHFHFHELVCEGKPVVILEIPRAIARPVQFQGAEYIRVGSYRQKLKDHPQIESELWRVFDETPFEEQLAAEHLSGQQVLDLLDYPAYFTLLRLALPSDRDGILARLVEDRMIAADDAGGWNVTNLGATLLARDLAAFRKLGRKVVRVIEYAGKGRMKAVREHTERRGYASGFEALIQFINALLPSNEVMGQALRKAVPMYPELAIRELVANALIHQDFTVGGTSPMIEIFDDRMEITNPGRALVTTDRFLDSAPRSRNEALASFMRRVGVCEERGSGVDKVVWETEYFQLPAPIFEATDDSTRAVLFAHRPFREMSREDRIRACYLHACLRYVQREPMTNASLRERFGIEEHNSAVASRIIGDAIEAGRIRPYDPNQGKKYARYIPWWA